MIDGFISSAAALCAVRMAPECADYMLASHRSGETAGGMVLDALGLSPFLDCRMSLGGRKRSSRGDAASGHGACSLSEDEYL